MDEKVEMPGPYEGGDIIGYLMKQGFELHDRDGPIVSITQVRDGAVIVTPYAILRVEPDWSRGGVRVYKIADL